MQGIKPLLPESPVPVKPLVDLGERLGTQAVNTLLCLLADLDKPRLPQHPEVAGYTRPGDGQQCRQLTGGCWAASQGLKHPSPALVRQCPQDGIHGMSVTR